MSGILHWLRIRAGAGEPFSKGIAKPVAPQPDEPVVLTAVENTQDVHNIVVCTLCSYVPTHLLPLATPHIPFDEVERSESMLPLAQSSGTKPVKLCRCYPTKLLGTSPHWYRSRSYRARVVRCSQAFLVV